MTDKETYADPPRPPINAIMAVVAIARHVLDARLAADPSCCDQHDIDLAAEIACVERWLREEEARGLLPPPVEPHALPLVADANGDLAWHAWGCAFAAAVRAAANMTALDAWRDNNQGTLKDLEAVAPKMFERLRYVIAERSQDFRIISGGKPWWWVESPVSGDQPPWAP